MMKMIILRTNTDMHGSMGGRFSKLDRLLNENFTKRNELSASREKTALEAGSALRTGADAKERESEKRRRPSKSMHEIRPLRTSGLGCARCCARRLSKHSGVGGRHAKLGDRSQRSPDKYLFVGELDGESTGIEMFTPITKWRKGLSRFTIQDERKGSVVAV